MSAFDLRSNWSAVIHAVRGTSTILFITVAGKRKAALLDAYMVVGTRVLSSQAKANLTRIINALPGSGDATVIKVRGVPVVALVDAQTATLGYALQQLGHTSTPPCLDFAGKQCVITEKS